MSSAAAKPPTILLVDDDEIVTSAIANLLELETDYRVLSHHDPVWALEVARREPVDVAISDFLMPEMDGLQFFRELAKVAPDVPRILLTGYADKESAIAAINEVNLYQYLEKPWDNDHLKMVLRNAIEHRTMQQHLGERLRELDLALRDRESLRQSAERWEQELALAQQVQQSILPRRLTDHGRFRFYHRYYPTGLLGGDYYDVAVRGDGQFNAIVADVAGHGVPASLGTMLVKVMFWEASERGQCCDKMLAEMNRRLAAFMPRHQFVTAFVLNGDGTSGAVTGASAGGPHPILMSRDNGAPTRLWVLNGLPLGVVPDSLYRGVDREDIRLRPGDRILLYTDGLLDSRIDLGETFDPRELVGLVDSLRHLDGEELLERLASARGVGGRALPDDVNLLLIDYE
jgi:serine phosphatase RsbU (regulator of sigma subunit)